METSEQTYIGTYLKNLREDRKISLETISNNTRINIKILQSLEENDFESLPSQTYVIGFVKNYMAQLKVGHDDALEILKNNYQERGDNPQKIQIEKSKKLAPKNNQLSFPVEKVLNKRNLVIFASLLVLLGLYQLIAYLSTSVSDTPVAASKPAVEENTEEDIVASSLEEETGEVVETIPETTAQEVSPVTTTTLAKIVVKQEERKKAEQIEEEKTEELSKEKNTERYPFVEFKEFGTPTYTISENESPDDIPANFRYHGGDENYLYIVASYDDCWIRYRTDDGKIKSFILKQGRHMFARGKMFFINTGNLGGLDIYFNNKKVEAESKSGFKHIILPVDNTDDYQIPLFVQDSLNNVYFNVDYKELMAEKPDSE
ncbi:MAG: helix-turn-helix domain-containing protein [Halobacteriovoraceae bacterium]|nr:helix-turn-helix domain-containing protein [Halobacteriovoraceae bacterium]MCB9095960.1 helix-turn-helix domain-containing protein [Halobacteriovoraceae bacterium]